MSKKVLKKGGKVISHCHQSPLIELDPDYIWENFIMSPTGENLAIVRDMLADNGLKPKIADV
jgi:hypothetical protein